MPDHDERSENHGHQHRGEGSPSTNTLLARLGIYFLGFFFTAGIGYSVWVSSKLSTVLEFMAAEKVEREQIIKLLQDVKEAEVVANGKTEGIDHRLTIVETKLNEKR